MEVSVNDSQLSPSLSNTLRKLKSLGCDKVGTYTMSNAVLSANGLSLNNLSEALTSGLAPCVDTNGNEIRPLTNIINNIVTDDNGLNTSFDLLLDISD